MASASSSASSSSGIQTFYLFQEDDKIQAQPIGYRFIGNGHQFDYTFNSQQAPQNKQEHRQLAQAILSSLEEAEEDYLQAFAQANHEELQRNRELSATRTISHHKRSETRPTRITVEEVPLSEDEASPSLTTPTSARAALRSFPESSSSSPHGVNPSVSKKSFEATIDRVDAAVKHLEPSIWTKAAKKFFHTKSSQETIQSYQVIQSLIEETKNLQKELKILHKTGKPILELEKLVEQLNNHAALLEKYTELINLLHQYNRSQETLTKIKTSFSSAIGNLQKKQKLEKKINLAALQLFKVEDAYVKKEKEISDLVERTFGKQEESLRIETSERSRLTINPAYFQPMTDRIKTARLTITDNLLELGEAALNEEIEKIATQKRTIDENLERLNHLESQITDGSIQLEVYIEQRNQLVTQLKQDLESLENNYATSFSAKRNPLQITADLLQKEINALTQSSNASNSEIQEKIARLKELKKRITQTSKGFFQTLNELKFECKVRTSNMQTLAKKLSTYYKRANAKLARDISQEPDDAAQPASYLALLDSNLIEDTSIKLKEMAKMHSALDDLNQIDSFHSDQIRILAKQVKNFDTIRVTGLTSASSMEDRTIYFHYLELRFRLTTLLKKYHRQIRQGLTALKREFQELRSNSPKTELYLKAQQIKIQMEKIQEEINALTENGAASHLIQQVIANPDNTIKTPISRFLVQVNILEDKLEEVFSLDQGNDPIFNQSLEQMERILEQLVPEEDL